VRHAGPPRCRRRRVSRRGAGARAASPRAEASTRRHARESEAPAAPAGVLGCLAAPATSSCSGEVAGIGTSPAYLIVLVASGSTLVLELVAGRVLTRFVGVSIHTWTTIIGVVLAGISLGHPSSSSAASDGTSQPGWQPLRGVVA
jgi:hypothetical protein